MSARKREPNPTKNGSQKGNLGLDAGAESRNRPIRVIAVSTLRDFWEHHADAEQALKAWYKEATSSRWSEPNDIKKGFPSADVIPGNRMVFNIKGNTYRLIVKIHYNTGIVFIRFIGTHAEYDKIDAESI